MSYPKSDDIKIQSLSNILIRYVEKLGVSFTFGGNDLFPVEALSDFGGLSLFLSESINNYNKIFNKSYSYEELMSGISNFTKINKDQLLIENSYFEKYNNNLISPVDFFEQEDGTFFGFVPKFNDSIANSFSLIAHLSIYSLDECIRKAKLKSQFDGKIPLDELYDNMIEKISSNKIKLVSINTKEKVLK